MATQDRPVIIIGAGISGLLLAQSLTQHKIPVRVFERDANLETRGVGWGLTLNWSLPALQSLLPEHLYSRLPEAYVDREAIKEGLSSRFPFFDLATGELKASTPKAPEGSRIRVTRKKLRDLLATGIDVEWEKALKEVMSTEESVTATFEDGSSVTGCLLVACDGSHSRVRRALFPDLSLHDIPVRMLGIKLELTPDQARPIRDLDPFFMHSTNSTNSIFVFMSMLDAPGNHQDGEHPYILQMCVSWPYRAGFFGRDAPIEIPETSEDQLKLIHELGETCAEPWRSLALGANVDSDTTGRVVLAGDALHAMAMYRGEGANHVILDVQDFVDRVVPVLKDGGDFGALRTSLDGYEKAVVTRTRPAVLASRQACLHAHDWEKINSESPLLTRRMPFVEFDESQLQS
ncbi:putative FAD-dependent monooxygenase [Fusarium culmorum]|uniref:Putative FAD-dependent monooxygenase n=1 Tax=Fusarium culmorum TaxID=5516 RepID=A0A2T4GZF2_FUSCU|nr:putative FAD-dependent monooxygenase [Fusarium culmorum]